jgi:hypothetical protein
MRVRLDGKLQNAPSGDFDSEVARVFKFPIEDFRVRCFLH